MMLKSGQADNRCDSLVALVQLFLSAKPLDRPRGKPSLDSIVLDDGNLYRRIGGFEAESKRSYGEC